MKWVVLPFSESYSEETKCIEVKMLPFSCNQVYYLSNSIWKLVRIIYNVSVFFKCQHSCRIYVLCAHSLYSKSKFTVIAAFNIAQISQRICYMQKKIINLPPSISLYKTEKSRTAWRTRFANKMKQLFWSCTCIEQ